MNDAEITAAALSDPGAQPLTDETARPRRRLPQARVIRRAPRLTHEEFAARYHIPVANPYRPRRDHSRAYPAKNLDVVHELARRRTPILRATKRGV